MRVRPLPKDWLIHTIDYTPPDGEDDWQNPIPSEPITIKNVRFDDSTQFSRDATQTKILANAIIFVDAKYSKPIPEFKEDTTIHFDGKDYTLKKIVPCYHPNRNEIHHWELEVV